MYSANAARDNYLNGAILNASPVELVCLLYRGGLDAIAAARRHLARREIRERGAAITRASLIVGELSAALDPAQGEVAGRLAAVYAYVLELLARAQVEQADPPLAEAEKLLGTLAEAWQQLAAEPAEPVGAGAPHAAINFSA